MMYWLPLIQSGPRPRGAVGIAGGSQWFTAVRRLKRGEVDEVLPADATPADILVRISSPRAPLAGLGLEQPRIMGILNTTPDSFSDGGRVLDIDGMASACDILDIGGESTRPGAEVVPEEEEVARIMPALRTAMSTGRLVSVDTRKTGVARAALAAGAQIVNDVSALGYDGGMTALLAETGAPVIIMHAQGSPETMQDAPRYDDVLLDVYDWLEERLRGAEAAGIPRERVVVDPGIGFGKTVEHNLRLLAGLGLFHGLGCAVLLGTSRKRFIGNLTGVTQPRDRFPGSIATALAGVARGVQLLRVHDGAATRQALMMWQAVNEAG